MYVRVKTSNPYTGDTQIHEDWEIAQMPCPLSKYDGSPIVLAENPQNPHQAVCISLNELKALGN